MSATPSQPESTGRLILSVINGMLILGFLMSIAWAFGAYGKSDFMDRVSVMIVLQFVCIGFMVIRGLMPK